MTEPHRDGPPPSRLLAIYLRHHAAAAQGGLDLIHRAARTHADPEARRTLHDLAREIDEDRGALLRIMETLGIARPRLGEILVGWAETVGRLKPNGTLVRRSPLSDVIELEALRTAVEAKELGWHSLSVLSESDERLDRAMLDELVRRATSQQDRLEELRRRAVAQTLSAR